jgi:CBS domain-containing protein
MTTALDSARDVATTTCVRDLMSQQLVTLDSSVPLTEAARQMFTADIGAVLVEENGKLSGIVTDRDIVIRALAQGRDVESTPLSAIASSDLTTVSPDAPLEQAIELMREKAIRRVLVTDSQNRAVGILSLGDVSAVGDAGAVLGQISAAPPNA